MTRDKMTPDERQQWLDERIDPEDQKKVNILPSRMMPAYTMSPEAVTALDAEISKMEEARKANGGILPMEEVVIKKSLYI